MEMNRNFKDEKNLFDKMYVRNEIRQKHNQTFGP